MGPRRKRGLFFCGGGDGLSDGVLQPIRMLESGERPIGLPQLKQVGYTLDDWRSWEGSWELIHGEATI